MPEDRQDDYLDAIDDAAADWRPVVMEDTYAPSFDEWNAMRLSRGLIVDTFEEYIAAIKSGKRCDHD